LLLLPRLHQIGELGFVLFHLGDGGAVPKEGAGRTRLHTFAARRAAFGVAPRLVHVRNDFARMSAARHVPGMRSLDLVADADAARTQDAAIVIDAEALVRHIDLAPGRLIIETDVIDAERRGMILK